MSPLGDILVAQGVSPDGLLGTTPRELTFRVCWPGTTRTRRRTSLRHRFFSAILIMPVPISAASVSKTLMWQRRQLDRPVEEIPNLKFEI
jgi:hypothetical protein